MIAIDEGLIRRARAGLTSVCIALDHLSRMHPESNELHSALHAHSDTEEAFELWAKRRAVLPEPEPATGEVF